MQHKAVSPRQQMLWEGLWTLYGNQENFRFENGILTTRDCWVADESAPLENFDFRFSARAPETATEAEIWAGFRHVNREYRYMVGLRGGSHKHLYLARLGAVGYDRMLALCPLEWSPEPGVWYQVRVVCAGCRIAVYLNGEEEPRILCTDEDAPFRSHPAGDMAVHVVVAGAHKVLHQVVVGPFIRRRRCIPIRTAPSAPRRARKTCWPG